VIEDDIKQPSERGGAANEITEAETAIAGNLSYNL